MRLRLFVTSFLLCVALASVIFAAVSTVQAYHAFQHDHQQVLQGDVNTVNSWMTIPYVARVYHIPEGCLAASLHIKDHQLEKYATLRMLADQSHRPVELILHEVRIDILNYRRNTATCGERPSNMPRIVPLVLPFLLKREGDVQ